MIGARLYHTGRRHPGRSRGLLRKSPTTRAADLALLSHTGCLGEAPMDNARDAAVRECPFLQPVRSPGRYGRRIGISCRFPDGRIRVPPVDEIPRFCVRGEWRRCLAYRRYAPAP